MGFPSCVPPFKDSFQRSFEEGSIGFPVWVPVQGLAISFFFGWVFRV